MKKIFLLMTLMLMTYAGFSQTAEDYYKQGIEKDYNYDYMGAIADYNKAIELIPTYAEAFYKRGNSKASLKDYRGAISDYSQAIELKSDFAKAYYHRGLARLSLDKIDDGCLDLSKAGELGLIDAYDAIQNYCR